MCSNWERIESLDGQHVNAEVTADAATGKELKGDRAQSEAGDGGGAGQQLGKN
jgi:hypothetical protein